MSCSFYQVSVSYFEMYCNETEMYYIECGVFSVLTFICFENERYALYLLFWKTSKP